MQWDADHPLLLKTSTEDAGEGSLESRPTSDDPTKKLVATRPLDGLLAIERSLASADAATRWVGYFSYDLGRSFEVIPVSAADDVNLPLIDGRFVNGELNSNEVTATPTHAKAVGPADTTSSPADDVKTSAHHAEAITPADTAFVRSNFTRDAYYCAVEKCLRYIAAGDVFQINLAQRFTGRFDGNTEQLFSRLTGRFPARYPAFLDFGRYAIISNSPELFLKVDVLPDGRRRIINRPIKGTRAVGPGQHDALLHSAKDKAELAMIVDLQRNDLGRICETGTVRVTEPRAIEAHPTVYHGVATIEGVLRQDVTLVDILRATFPCGSVTGCPKIRAMQIIEEIEPVRRGPYCGAIGWIGQDGSMELSVAIRIMVITDGRIHFSVGGGIVADSRPADEFEETLAKAAALFTAAGVKPEE